MLAVPLPSIIPSTRGAALAVALRGSMSGLGREFDDAHQARDRQWSHLMARAQAGDTRAYSELLKDIVPVLRLTVRRRHASPDRAEDVVQDILLTLHRVRHTYDPSRPFSGWLFAIAHRRSIDAVRVRMRHIRHESALDGSHENAQTEEPQSGADAELALSRAMAALPERQRVAIDLLKLRGFSLNEASAQSGLSVGALKVAAHRAMKTLKRHLAGS